MKPYYEHAGITIYHGDCLEILPSISADVVISDPPYNAGKNYGVHDDNMERLAYIGFMSGVWGLAGATGAASLVFTPGTRNIWDVSKMVNEPWRPYRLLGWHRKEFAGDKFSGGPAISWEPVVWAIQTEKAVWNKQFGHGGRDFLVVPCVRTDPFRAVHPCPKPPAVMRWLVNLFAPKDGIVLDPFMGSGTTLRAAKDLSRKAIGIEIEEKFCEIAAKRLAQEVLL